MIQNKEKTNWRYKCREDVLHLPDVRHLKQHFLLFRMPLLRRFTLNYGDRKKSGGGKGNIY